MNTTMPSETITGITGSVVGAVLVIIGSVYDLEVDAAVAGAITTLVAWMAFAVTLVVRARRVRQGEMDAREARPRG